MRHNIKATGFSMTPAIKEYVEKRVNHLDKFFDPNQKELPICYVEIGKTTNHHKTGDLFRAEYTLYIGGKSLRIEAEKDDLYVSIDSVTEGLIEELKSFKEKKVSLIRKGGAKIKALIKGFYGDK